MTSATQSAVEALLKEVAFTPITDRAFFRISGQDRTRWLNGMVTNSAQALQPGEGNYNFLLNAQGRIQGDCTLWRDPDPNAEEFLLETTSAQAAAIQQHLDHFIIMDDVEILPIMDDQHGLLLAGPGAEARLIDIGIPAPTPNHAERTTYCTQPVLILSPHAPLVPLYELWASPQTIDALRIALEADTVPAAASEALEHLRILSGTPAYGTDIRNSETARDLPQETNQPHALHFAKGCYLGQEIVERIRSRGQVHRQFTGFRLSGPVPALPAALTTDGKSAGELTSAATIGNQTYALGYARREALDLHQPLRYDGGEATPSPLPFRYP